MDVSAMSVIDSRWATLERRARRRDALLLVFLLAVPIAWSSAPGDSQEIVRARTFALVDRQGTVWAELKLEDGAPGLFIYDANGVSRASLAHGDDGTALYLSDELGDTRVGVAQFAHGGGGVALHGPENKGAAVLYYKDGGSLTFYDAEGGVIHRIPAR